MTAAFQSAVQYKKHTMHNGYLVVAKDGKEYGPLDRDTIQRWYYEGRLDQNSRVYEPGKHKFRLKEVFDLTVWRNPALIDEAAARAKAQPAFIPKTNIIAVPKERTLGMLVAAFLLLALGLVEVLVIASILTQQIDAPRGALFEYTLGAIFDLVLAIGLFRGNQKFRGWGLARAVIGGVLIVLGLVVGNSFGSDWVSACFELLMCGGIAALLAGESPSKVRVWAGAAAVLVAWSGIITADFVSRIIDREQVGSDADSSAFDLFAMRGAPARKRSELDGYRLPVAAFEDDTLGVSMRLPSGWTMLTPDNPIVNMPEATMIDAHERSGCVAMLVVEPKNIQIPSLAGYLGTVLIQSSSREPSMKTLGIDEIRFGGNYGRRARTAWTTAGEEVRGFTTVCEAGGSYYLLTGWSREETWPDAFEEYQVLESAFRIRGTPMPLPAGAGARR